MYADRYAKPTRFNPGGLTAAIAINAALVAALMFAGRRSCLRAPTMCWSSAISRSTRHLRRRSLR